MVPSKLRRSSLPLSTPSSELSPGADAVIVTVQYSGAEKSLLGVYDKPISLVSVYELRLYMFDCVSPVLQGSIKVKDTVLVTSDLSGCSSEKPLNVTS